MTTTSIAIILLLGVFAALILLRTPIPIALMTSTALTMLYLLRRSNVKHRVKFLRLASPSMLILMLLGSVFFPLLAGQIISIPAVSRFVTSVLGRSATLTGRLNIFEIFGDKMQNFWLWGCGVGNGHAAATWLFGYDNAQNAIYQWLLEGGVFITAFLCALIVYVFHQLAQSERREKLLPLIALIYVYVIMGAVEITINMSFILLLAVLFMLINETESPETAED